MGKLSPEFEVKEHEFYPTPKSAVEPLVKYVLPTSYAEPCVGDGALVRHLTEIGGPEWSCVAAQDIVLRDGAPEFTIKGDSRDYKVPREAATILTNPPWSKEFLTAALPIWLPQRPTMLLLSARVMQARWFAWVLHRYATHVIPAGRLQLFPDSGSSGKHTDAVWVITRPECDPDRMGPVYIPRDPFGKDEHLMNVGCDSDDG